MHIILHIHVQKIRYFSRKKNKASFLFLKSSRLKRLEVKARFCELFLKSIVERQLYLYNIFVAFIFTVIIIKYLILELFSKNMKFAFFSTYYERISRLYKNVKKTFLESFSFIVEKNNKKESGEKRVCA